MRTGRGFGRDAHPFARSRAVGILALALGSLALGGCSQMSNPTYELDEVGCTPVPDGTTATIQERVTAPGTLRHARVVTRDDESFVSAELHLRADDRHAKGDILTWATTDLEGTEFLSVDVHAREESTWPPADVTVQAGGARESRACVLPNRGKTTAQVRCENDQAGDPLTDLDCDDR